MVRFLGAFGCRADFEGAGFDVTGFLVFVGFTAFGAWAIFCFLLTAARVFGVIDVGAGRPVGLPLDGGLAG